LRWPPLPRPKVSKRFDPAGYEEYKKFAGVTVEKYGGKTEALEGDWQPRRIVVLPVRLHSADEKRKLR
jgi:uncharacterized protein (DUF1330 family)